MPPWPSPLGGGDGLVVVGGDDEGTVNAGVELAARLPRVWGMNGIALPGVEDQAIRHLRAHGVQAREAGVSSIVVDSDKRGVARVTLRLVVAEADGARAAKVLEELELAHRRGQEPRTLNFTNVAATAIDVVAGAKVVAHVEVSRTGLNQRTLTPPIDPDELAADSPGDRGRPADAGAGGAPARTFDLSNALSIDGWYGDAYADLIPDRTDTTIVLGGAADSLPAAHIAARLGLETTGITLPLTRVADKVRTPEREPSPILVGRSNALDRSSREDRQGAFRRSASPAKAPCRSCRRRSAMPRRRSWPAPMRPARRPPPRISPAACRTSGTTRAARFRLATSRCS